MPRKKYPKRIRADVERGFIIAYYELVRGLDVVLGLEDGSKDDMVAVAWSPVIMIGMDFSSYYHFTEGYNPQTRLRHVREKVERLKHFTLPVQHREGKALECLYEVWCFMPPNEYVLQAIGDAKQDGLPVKLVDQEELHRRVRRTAEIVPEDDDMVEANAFLWSAQFFREAGAWKG